MSQSGFVHLENCQITVETGSAFLVVWRRRRLWIPKSQVADPDNYCDGDKGVTLSVTEWVARKKRIDPGEAVS